MVQTNKGKTRKIFNVTDSYEQTTNVRENEHTTVDILRIKATHERERKNLNTITYFPRFEEGEAKPSAPTDFSAATSHAPPSNTRSAAPRMPVDHAARATLAQVAYASGEGERSGYFDCSAPNKKGEISHIQSLLLQTSLYQHITDKKTVISRRHWTQTPELNGIQPQKLLEMTTNLMAHERKADRRFNNVTEVAKASIEYNCHGYTFTNGKGGWLTATDAKNILEDNQFHLIASFDGIQRQRDPQTEIKAGDVVAYYTYFDANTPIKEPDHTAVVAEVIGDQIWVISKWGLYGLNKHPIDVVPKEYKQQWAIFHTERKKGRLVTIDG
ncbi:MAG TPA: hypothetical protein VL461_15165 [Dictyobacter sp.]|nr:hypothetical protein [Dictyobacter sp.]